MGCDTQHLQKEHDAERAANVPDFAPFRRVPCLPGAVTQPTYYMHRCYHFPRRCSALACKMPHICTHPPAPHTQGCLNGPDLSRRGNN